MRTTIGILLASVSVLTLSACTTGPQTGCEADVQLGGLADTAVTSGQFDDLPAKAEFPIPLVADEASRAIMDVGDGRVVQPGDAVEAMITIYDGETGAAVDGGEILLFNNDEALPMLAATACTTVGSRVVTVAPAFDFLGEYTSSFGFEEDHTVLAVLDIHAAYPGRVSGVTVEAVEGLPAVTTAPNGQPGLTFTGAPAPDELAVETLIQGHGETVEAGDTIVVNYIGVEWETREVFDDSWSTGRPHSFSLDDVVPGFQKAVIGAQTGSRILVAIPPSEGYGDGGGSPVGPDNTMIFVIDLLGIDDAAD